MRRLLPTCDDNARVIGGGEKRNETRWLPTDDDAVLLAGIAVYNNNNNKNNNDVMSIAVIDRPKRFSGRKLSRNSITRYVTAQRKNLRRDTYTHEEPIRLQTRIQIDAYIGDERCLEEYQKK